MEFFIIFMLVGLVLEIFRDDTCAHSKNKIDALPYYEGED